MPELPEVQTMVNDLKEKVLQRTFLDIWTDTPKIIHYPETTSEFKKLLIGKKIAQISRYGKVIVFCLSDQKKILVHQFGHIPLTGQYINHHGHLA